jgi:hypothetical protein
VGKEWGLSAVLSTDVGNVSGLRGIVGMMSLRSVTGGGMEAEEFVDSLGERSTGVASLAMPLIRLAP